MTISSAFGSEKIIDQNLDLSISTKEEFARRLMERFHISYHNYEAIRSLIIPATNFQNRVVWDESPFVLDEDEILFDKVEGKGLVINIPLIRRYKNMPEESVKEIKEILDSGSTLLGVSISDPELDTKFKEAFPYAHLRVSNILAEVYPNRTLREHFEIKLDYSEYEVKERDHLLSLSREKLISEFYYEKEDVKNIYQKLLNESDDLREALSSIDISTCVRRRALIRVLFDISYCEKALGGLERWKGIVRVLLGNLLED